MKPVITTIIPTFQRASLLKKSVSSVLSQTYPHFQLIVCDNGSTDETEEMMREFANNDSRVIYHRHAQNIGMMQNYKFGFSKVTSPFFTFLSDDDSFSPWFYETALSDFEQFPYAAFSICQVHAINLQQEVVMDSLCLWNKRGYFKNPKGFLEMISPSLKTPIPTCTLFNKKIIGKIEPDFSNEIQHVWDHNYFLQLAAQFPYIVNEKSCGFFLAHEEGFSTGFFERLKNSQDELDTYLKAFSRLIGNVINNPHLSIDTKIEAEKLLKKSYNDIVLHFRGVVLTNSPIDKCISRFTTFAAFTLWLKSLVKL